MEILIKSFNRPFYLDRCLASVKKNVKGDYLIKVLDDGTPEKYLEKIQKKYPEVEIVLSDQAKEKRLAIEENLQHNVPIDGFTIPTSMWKKAVEQSEKYVLVTEDDVWFTENFDAETVIEEMEKFKIPLVKLGWLGMKDDASFCKIQSLSENLTEVTPKKIFTANEMLMDGFMYNKFKFFTVLYKLGFVDNTTKNKYWTLNSILMGLYDKNYWLTIWKDAAGKVDEKQQLRNAAVWFHRNRNAIFAKNSREIMKTTFQSAATGSYHENVHHFDVNRFNHIISEAWFSGDFDAMENYPHDFSEAYIKTFLDKENHPDAQYSDWVAWAERFKNQYKNQGAITH